MSTSKLEEAIEEIIFLSENPYEGMSAKRCIEILKKHASEEKKQTEPIRNSYKLPEETGVLIEALKDSEQFKKWKGEEAKREPLSNTKELERVCRWEFKRNDFMEDMYQNCEGKITKFKYYDDGEAGE